MKLTDEELARRIITSIIEASVTEGHIKEFLEKVDGIPFYGIAVDLPFLSISADLLKNTDTKLVTISSYPLGGMTTEVKVKQVEFARKYGADAIDVGINCNAAKSGDFKTVEDDVRKVVNAAGDREVVMCTQLGILTNQEKIKVCQAILNGGSKAIKTNSGMVGLHTDIEDVELIKREFGDELIIEASSGIRTREQALAMLEAGADIIHTSTPFKMSENWKEVNFYEIVGLGKK